MSELQKATNLHGTQSSNNDLRLFRGCPKSFIDSNNPKGKQTEMENGKQLELFYFTTGSFFFHRFHSLLLQ